MIRNRLYNQWNENTEDDFFASAEQDWITLNHVHDCLAKIWQIAVSWTNRWSASVQHKELYLNIYSFFKYIPDHLSRMRDATTKLGPGAPSRSHASSQVAQKIQLQYSEKTKNQLITLCSQPTAPAEHHHRHHHKPYSLICWKGAIWKICRKFKRKDLGTGRK